MIIDTGPIVAAIDADDDAPRRMRTTTGHCTPAAAHTRAVLTEVCYLVEREQGSQAEAMFLTNLADGEFELIHPTTTDLRRMAELVTTYHDLPLGAVDASTVKRCWDLPGGVQPGGHGL